MPQLRAKLSRCPKCLSELDPASAACAACGAPVGESAQALQIAKRPQAQQRGTPVILAVAAMIGAGMITFAVLALRGGPSPALAAAESATGSAERSPAAAGAAPEISETQTWSADNRRFWLADRRGAAFQLLAENKVHTWFGPTQPVLVVRCASHGIEAFVYTRSATRIEPQEGKTVTVAIDGETPRTERWTDSEDKVALFAPDGAAFVRALVRAKTLRFGYSPHNADDVVAQFHVAGLGRVMEPAARDCGWKK